MSQWEDEDGVDGPFDQAMVAAIEEDRMARNEMQNERIDEAIRVALRAES